jgi:hypothetical protein
MERLQGVGSWSGSTPAKTLAGGGLLYATGEASWLLCQKLSTGACRSQPPSRRFFISLIRAAPRWKLWTQRAELADFGVCYDFELRTLVQRLLAWRDCVFRTNRCGGPSDSSLCHR